MTLGYSRRKCVQSARQIPFRHVLKGQNLFLSPEEKEIAKTKVKKTLIATLVDRLYFSPLLDRSLTN